jgi:hypothetical protein
MDNKYEIVIDFEDFITRTDLNTILGEIELTIETHLLGELGLSPLRDGQVGGTYLKIEGARQGSIALTVAVAVIGLLSPAFGEGFKKGKAGKEAGLVGKTASDLLGEVMGPVRKALQKLLKRLQANGSKVKGVRLRRLNRPTGSSTRQSAKNKPSKSKKTATSSQPSPDIQKLIDPFTKGSDSPIPIGPTLASRLKKQK